jgi:hypothetical protein
MSTNATTRGCACQRGTARRSWFGLSFGLSTLLFVPKCPLCLAAYFALGSAAVPLFAILRPAALALVLCSVVGLTFAWLRARRERLRGRVELLGR